MATKDAEEHSIEFSGDELQASNVVHPEEAWADSIVDAKSRHSSTARIPRVPAMVRDSKDYDKFYVPKVVSIGPYHYGDPKLKFVQNLKPVFMNKLLSNNKETVKRLYRTICDLKMVQQLRDFYEERSTEKICNEEFTKMMLLDACFILYYIDYIFLGDIETYLGLKSHQIVFVHQDLFLLENQIPFQVLNEVMKLVEGKWRFKIRRFVKDNILASTKPKSGWSEVTNLWHLFRRTIPTQNLQSSTNELEADFKENHLLQLLQHRLTQTKELGPRSDRYTFRNVNELLDVGIHFKPSKAESLAHIKFFGGGFSACLELPPITVDDSTKPMLLNLVAYEMCSDVADDSWVTSYICLLDSLIDHPEDVKVLRKAGVLDNCLGSDKEVAKLFNEIGTDLVPNTLAYSNARTAIQKHYDSKRNTLICQLKHEYIKSPWSFLALVGGVVALFLSGVQAYFSVWGLNGPCDDLCVALKMNHHL